MDAKTKIWDDEFNKKWNRMMMYANIGIAVSLSMFFGGIGMMIYGYLTQ